MLVALCSWFHDKAELSVQRSLPMFLSLFVPPLFPSRLQEYAHDAHQGTSPILPIPPALKALLRLAGKAKQSLDEKGIVFVIPVVKGQSHPRFFHL